MAPQTTDYLSNGDIEGLLAFHRTAFGGARMEDEGTEESDSTEPPAEGSTEESTEGTEEDGADGTEGEKPEPKPEDELPEWAKKELTKVRGEAANYRVQLREAQEQLGKAKTPEEYEAATQQMGEKIAELEHTILRNTVAAKYELPAELAGRLQGKTEAELEADAKSLQQFMVPAAPERLSGGLDPNDDDDSEMDPGALARKHGRRR